MSLLVSQLTRPSFWLGFYLATLNGFMFAIGTVESSLLYLAPLLVALVLLLTNNLTIDRRLLGFTLLLASIVTLGIARAAINADGPSSAPIDAIINYGRGLLIFVIIILLVKSDRDLHTFLAGSGFSFIFLLLFSGALAASYFSDPALYAAYGELFQLSRPSGFSGLYHNPNYWSIFLLSSSLFLLYLRKAGFIRSTSFYILLGLLGFQLVLSGSRMGMAGIVLLLIGIWSLGPRPTSTVNKLSTLTSFLRERAPSIFLVIGTIPAALYLAHPYLLTITQYERAIGRASRLFDMTQHDDEPRIQLLTNALEIFFSDVANMFVGAGLRIADTPHNSFITILVELGPIALLAFIGFWALIFLTSLKRYALSRRPASFFLATAVPLIFWMCLTNDYVETRSFWIVFGLAAVYILRRLDKTEHDTYTLLTGYTAAPNYKNPAPWFQTPRSCLTYSCQAR